MAINTLQALSFPDLVSEFGTRRRYPLGTVRNEGGDEFIYVGMDAGATAAVVGKLAYHVDGDYTVTATAANTDDGLLCGSFVSVIPASQFGWVRTKGRQTLATIGAADIVKGDGLISAAAAAGQVRRPALTAGGVLGPEARTVADRVIMISALANESASTVDAILW